MSNYLASGQINIDEVGVAKQGPTNVGVGWYYIGGKPGNTGNVAVGNDGNGDVTINNGFVLDAGQFITYFGDIADLWFDGDTADDDVCWFKYRK